MSGKTVYMKIFYMAIAIPEGYTVGRGGRNTSIRALFNIRNFSTFEEADKAAKFIADGKAEYHSGEYINNR